MWSPKNYYSQNCLFMAVPKGMTKGNYTIFSGTGNKLGTFDCSTGRFKVTEGELSCLELKDLAELGEYLKKANQ